MLQSSKFILEKTKPIFERRVIALELAYAVCLNFFEERTTSTNWLWVS
jgi:hypothetical protein